MDLTGVDWSGVVAKTTGKRGPVEGLTGRALIVRLSANEY